MSAVCNFISGKSAGLVELDTNGDVLWTWAYPSISEDDRKFFIRKSELSLLSPRASATPFLYSQWRGDWYYIHTSCVEDTDNLKQVTHFALVLVTKDFNPEKYEELCKILSKKYRKTGSAAAMLETYLGVFTRGNCSTEDNGVFSASDFENKKAYLKCKLRGIIETFGVETIILYTAVMLKKRIAVYYPHNQIQQLLSFVRSLPALVWHRQNWNIAYTLVDMNPNELDTLKGSNSYVAGFTDASVEGRSDLYDVFVNPSAGQISIATHAKEALAMGKLHKDTAMFMVQCVENDNFSEADIIKEIAKKTNELLNNLKSLASIEEDGKHYVTLEALRERKMTPATENFLFSLAACEGLVKF